jgi:TPR repeat protein
MLISNRVVRTYLFVSKAAIIHNKSFQCHVSTAKEGWFQKLSTIIFEPRIGNTVGAGAAGFRPCGKVIYSPTLRKSDRLQFHDVIAKTLDAAGEEGCTLEEALEQIFADLKRRGIAVETVNLAADQVQADAQFNLGGLRTNAEGVPQGDTQMAALLRKTAEQGDAKAQYSLGVLYYEGWDVPQDYAQAAFWYRKAAEQGDDDAQYLLGRLYREGQGVPQDYAQAAFWYRKAAEQGNADAQYGLGVLYYDGRGVPQDRAQAATWFRKAAQQGVALAQCLLGLLYHKGQGVLQDYAEAYFWLDVAAAGKLDASDMERAAKLRDDNASMLTPAELSREQQRVRKWFEAHQAKPQ